MSNYLFIETQDPFDSADTRFVSETAASLHRSGHGVTVFLVQNGVLAARKDSSADDLRQLLAANIAVVADDFSLAERGIVPDEMRAGIEVSNIEALVDQLVVENTKAIWH